MLKFLLVAAVLLTGIAAPNYGAEYPIPNQFDASNGYYHFKSSQTITKHSEVVNNVNVQEYMSLAKGLTFSLHMDRKDSERKYLFISDGVEGRAYVVRHPYDANFECELDQMHSYRHIFPWQYEYDMATPSGGRRKRRRRRKGSSDDQNAEQNTIRSSVYGVGAIWLNAIERNVTTTLVGSDSFKPALNIWKMTDHNLEVELNFEANGDPDDGAKLKRSKLHSIDILRSKQVASNSSTEHGDACDQITIVEFDVNVDETNLDPVFMQALEKCRESNRKHRAFPSLVRALNLSPERVYSMEYITTRTQEAIPRDHNNNRPVGETEYVVEWLSFKKEAQTFVYEPLPLVRTGVLRADVFLRQFTARASGRSSRHANQDYHIIEKDGQVTDCKANEHELSWLHLLARNINFYRKDGEIKLSGTMLGLGALLMNANEFHYKQFQLISSQISVRNNPADLSSSEMVEADEWIVEDKRAKFQYHFYFANGGKQGGDVTSLKMVEVCDTSQFSKGDFLIRYEILHFDLRPSEEDLEFVFTPPKECNPSPMPPIDDSDDSADDPDSDNFFNDNEQEDKFNNFDDYDNGNDSDMETNSDQDQEMGQEFELRPGRMVSIDAIPSFYDFLDTFSSYEFLSRVELDGESERSLYLRETYSASSKILQLKVYNSKESVQTDIATKELYINYKTEFIYMNEPSTSRGDTCKLSDNVWPWLRLLSSPYTNNIEWRLSNSDNVGSVDQISEQSDRLRYYGIAALWQQATESEDAEFVGMRRTIFKGLDKNDYKEVLWSQNKEDGDLEYEFKFYFNETMYRSNKFHQKRDLLHLDSIRTIQPFEYDDTVFKMANIHVLRQRLSNSIEVKMPAGCQNAVYESEMIRIKREHEAIEEARMPTIADYFNTTKVGRYELHYIVAMDQRVKFEWKTITMDAIENFKVKSNRGYLTLTSSEGGVSAVYKYSYFFEGADQKTYQQDLDTSRCQEVERVEFIDELNPYASLFVDQRNENMDPRKMFGLAALWNGMSRLGRLKLKKEISRLQDRPDLLIERRSYTAKLKRPDGREEELKVKFSFTGLHMLSSPNGSDSINHQAPKRFTLQRVELVPEFKDKSPIGESRMYHTDIHIVSLKTSDVLDWTLPGECTGSQTQSSSTTPFPEPLFDDTTQRPKRTTTPAPTVAPTTTTPKPPLPTDAEFPKISQFVRDAHFHMRSEVVVKRDYEGKQIFLYVIDEWAKNGVTRMRTRRLSKNLDVIIYPDTNEIFDISTPYKCNKYAPSFSFMSQPDDRYSLLKFWSDERRTVSHLSLMLYGPLNLWLMAEQGEKVRNKLIDANDLGTFKSTGNESTGDAHEYSIRAETWRVSSSDTDWSYDMNFEKVYHPTAKSGPKTWHVLNSIIVHDAPYGNQEIKVDIEVVNYRYDHTQSETIDIFKLPEGYGCARQNLFNGFWDETKYLARYSGGRITYEASMEIAEDPALSAQRRILPHLSGMFVSTPKKADYHSNFVAHYTRTRTPDGEFKAKKMVYDPLNNLVYHIDRMTGYCTIELVRSFEWLLEFPTGGGGGVNGSELVELDELNILQMFAHDAGKSFNPLNYYELEGLTFVTYERELPVLYLGPDRKPWRASIVSSFIREPDALPRASKDGNGSFYYHDSASVRVYLFDESRSRLEKVFTIGAQFKQIGDTVQLDELLRDVSVAQCFNDGDSQWEQSLESFVLEYKMEGIELILVLLTQARIKTLVYESLMRNAGIYPLQLDGRIRVETTKENFVRIHFNVYSPPTAYLHFQELTETTMYEKMEVYAEVRLTSSVVKCSKLCDEVDCFAMSYCKDRTCKVVPRKTLTQNKLSKNDRYHTEPNSQCSYYYQEIPMKRPSLESFRHSMEKTINEQRKPDQLELYSINIGGDPILPERFFAVKKRLDEDTEQLDSSVQEKKVFHIVHKDAKLDATKIKDLPAGFKVKAYPAPLTTYATCLSECEVSLDDCLAMSFCKAQNECLVFTGTADPKLTIDSLMVQNSTGCSITMRDHTIEYDKFENVRQTFDSFAIMEDYTAIDCAAACSNNPDCLSFESCEQLRETHKTRCYLIKSHKTQSVFDRSAIDGNWKTTYKCDHYSKEAIYDFKKLANKKFAKKAGQVVRGEPVDKCAIDCEQDEECRAYEYCYNPSVQPAQACYFITTPELKSSGLSSGGAIESLLKSSKHCSVYVLRGENLQTFGSSWMELAVPAGFFATLFKVIAYITGAILIGACVQVAYIRLAGDSLLFH